MAEEEVAAASSDNKRKFEDLEADATRQESTDPNGEPLLSESRNENGDAADAPAAAEAYNDMSLLDESEPKRPRLDDETGGSAVGLNDYEDSNADDNIRKDEKDSAANLNAEHDQQMHNGNGEKIGDQPSDKVPEPIEIQKDSVEKSELETSEEPPKETQQVAGELTKHDSSSAEEYPKQMGDKMTRKIEVPNNKVGVLIGKAGDTIRYLQINSGAKIQITRDADADLHSTSRPVELIGSLDSLDKAEKLINAVIAEADAGGSPSLVARGLSSAQASADSEQIQMQVPNEKVGLIIGRGGETIRSMQTRSGARIQLIPQHPSEGDSSKERTVQVTGGKREIELAKELIKEAMSQPVRPSPHSGNFNQQPLRPHGHVGPTQWGHRGYAQPTGYDYQHRGPYPTHNSQYQHPTYGSYQQQVPPRGNFGSGWEHRPSLVMQGQHSHSHSGTYDYYGAQGGHLSDGPASAQLPGSTSQIHGSSLPAMGQSGHQGNYNYGPPQGPDYGHQPPYSQAAVPQQGYGHGYDENRAAAQHPYGGHGNSQTGYPQVGGQPGYTSQQHYGKPPSYGFPPQGQPPQSYGASRGGQPGEVSYQGSAPTQSCGLLAVQQQYPYTSTGPPQHTYPYGTIPAADAYNQQPPAPGPLYTQQAGQAGYVQPGAQQVPAYGQATGAYGSYATSQGYPEAPAANNTGYGYQGPQESGYSGASAAGYSTPAVGQTGYAQSTPAAQAGYEQSATQPGGYGAVPAATIPAAAIPAAAIPAVAAAAVPASYGKTLSPQPGYAPYDSTQVYAGPR